VIDTQRPCTVGDASMVHNCIKMQLSAADMVFGLAEEVENDDSRCRRPPFSLSVITSLG
jgi:hypothetical protein